MELKHLPPEAGSRPVRVDELASLTDEDLRATLRPFMAALDEIRAEPDAEHPRMFRADFIKSVEPASSE
jgi:hypothetical protein